MKDHEIRELVNSLRDIAIKYHSTQSLRERIAHVVRTAMLQAGTFRENENSSTESFREISKTSTNSPVIPEGYVMVPKEPTEAMINAWLSEVANWRGHVAGYKAMLAAAPQEVK